MCEYLVVNTDKNSLLKCSITGTLCTLCVLGNAFWYNQAKERSKNMKVCELKINDMQSVKDMTHSLLLNKYTVKSTAVYKKYPREDSIDYFKIEVFDNNLPLSNEKEEENISIKK